MYRICTSGPTLDGVSQPGKWTDAHSAHDLACISSARYAIYASIGDRARGFSKGLAPYFGRNLCIEFAVLRRNCRRMDNGLQQRSSARGHLVVFNNVLSDSHNLRQCLPRLHCSSLSNSIHQRHSPHEVAIDLHRPSPCSLFAVSCNNLRLDQTIEFVLSRCCKSNCCLLSLPRIFRLQNF